MAFELLVRDCPEAAVVLAQKGADSVDGCFNIANQLHMRGKCEEASFFYRRAFELHSKQPNQFPTAHGLLQVRLLCLLKASIPAPDEELAELKALSIPFFEYICACKLIFTKEPDYRQALRTFGNAFEEFHTGEEADRIYLRAATGYLLSSLEPIVKTQGGRRQPAGQVIPRRLFFFWDKEPPPEIAENFRYHEALPGFEVEIFDKQRAAEWLYSYHGVSAREIFLKARHPAEAADFLRIHVINQYGGYWVDADMKIRSVERFDEVFPRNVEGVYPVTDGYLVHNDFFGSVANSPVLNDALLSLYRNCFENQWLNFAYKTGPGVFTRALNRCYYRALTGSGQAPNVAILSQAQFDYALEAYPVSYKGGAGNWQTVGR
jgi:hypothetical protein